MGNRVMEKPNLNGGTVARHYVPRRVRRSRKRSLRKAGKVQKPAKAAKRVSRTRAPRIAAKVPKPMKPAARLSQKQAPRPTAKAPKPVKPAEQTQRSDQKLVVDEVEVVPIDRLQDGPIEWGIKRNTQTGS